MVPTTHQKQHLVIIGAGMAGTRLAINLAKASDQYRITLLNQEPCAGYNRIMLSPVLAGEKSFAEITLFPQQTYQQWAIELKTHAAVSQVDIDKKTLQTVTGEQLSYDKLVFATGSNPFVPALPNHDAEAVFCFRTQDDVTAMLQVARQPGKRMLVIGAGLLGLEAASALAKQGAQVTVVHRKPHILDRQLDAQAAALLQDAFSAKGVAFLLATESERIEVNEQNQVTGLQFKNGSRIDTDAIIITVGVKPNISLAKSAGIACEKGILVDNQMRTQTADIYAIGECVEFEKQLFGLVAPAYEQADVLVKTLCQQQASFSVKPTATKLKVSGIDLFSAGDIAATDDRNCLTYLDQAKGIYQKLILEKNKLVAAVLYGDVADGAWFFELIQEQTDISGVREQLLFGQAFCADQLGEA